MPRIILGGRTKEKTLLRTRVSSLVLTIVATAALGGILTGTALAGPSASLEQVRNGVATDPVTPIPTWGTGNAGASNSHYLESHSIAYRTVMDQLPTDGSIVELIIGYDVKRSGSYAIDYLTHFQRLLPHVLFGHKLPEVFDPLSGVAGVGSIVTTAPIPVPSRNLAVDPDGSEPEPAAPQPSTSMNLLAATDRLMTLYGGTILDVSYVTEADPAASTRSSETQIKVRLIADGPKAVLAWGGHIACRWDWGFNPDGSPRSAGGISGSSYHMRLVRWTLGSLGSQDRSMSTDAVYPVPRCGITNLGPFCAGSIQTHTAPAGMESYSWSLFDNTCGASFVGGTTGLSVVVQSATGGSYGLLLTTGASGFTKQCQATITVNGPVVVDAGPDQTACASSPLVQLSGVVSGGIGSWSGGTGTFNPNAGALNGTYLPSAAEIAAGGVTLTLTGSPAGGPCPPASDAIRVTILRAATANAGADQTVCASNPSVQLAGSVGGGAVGGTWSGGTGAFSPSPDALNATYTPSPQEIAAGVAFLTLTSNDPDGPCAAASDQMRVTVSPAASVDAGPDQSVCASNPVIQLAGSLGGSASSATWSGGAGAFSPSATGLSALYTPTAVEIAAGSVTLTLTTNDPAGPCPAISDVVRFSFNASATANAGADQTVCASSPQVQLAGSVGGAATSGTWSGGEGVFAGGPTALNATYTPTAAEIANGGLTLTLTTDDPAGPCSAVSDQMRIVFQPAATANAGPDQTVCASNPRVQLAGSVGGGATSGSWSGGAGTFGPKNTALNATYTPTAAEIAAGSVTLTLTTDDPAGACAAVSDQMSIRIDPMTVVDAGPDQTVCSSSAQVQLTGFVRGTVSSGTWSGGAGTFSPAATALNAVYTPTTAEIAAGTLTLTLTSATPTGPCPASTDAMIVTIQPALTVNAGPDQIVCAATPTVQLAGSMAKAATSCVWSGGSGTYGPNATTLNASYTPTAAEVAAGSVTLTLTTNDPAGPCPAISDAMKITFDAPTVTVSSRVACGGVSPASLCASPSRGVAPYTYRWSTGATTQCISVADTGSYTVTIVDSKGCQAQGSGAFRWRDCVGMLAHTSTTCSGFQGGTGDSLASSDVHYVIKDNLITTISPGVFFYYTKVTAPSPDFFVYLVQTRDNTRFPLCEVAGEGQVALYDSDCNRIGTGSETSPGQASVAVTGARLGQVFIISVKYSLKSLVGAYMDSTMGVHYDFRTMINGQVVDQDPDGLQIGKVQATTSGDPNPTPAPTPNPNPDEVPYPMPRPGSSMGAGLSDADGLELYRPAPNPFRDGMRMAYAVGSNGQRVTIRVFDLAGRAVRTLANEFQPAGRHLVSWDGRNEEGSRMHRGVYFVHVWVGEQTRQVRVTFLQ